MQLLIACRSSKCRFLHYLTPSRAVGVDALPCFTAASAHFHTDGVTGSRFRATVFFFFLKIGRIKRFSVQHRGARSGGQGKSELSVQRADTTSNHCRRHEAGTLHHFGNPARGLLITPCLIETQFSITCRDGDCFPSVSTCSKPTFFLVLRLWSCYHCLQYRRSCHHFGGVRLRQQLRRQVPLLWVFQLG